MKSTIVSFNLYGIRFDSRPMSAETAQEMVRQLADRDIKDARVAQPRPVWMTLRDGHDGTFRVDSSGLLAYENPEVAREDMARWLFSAGYQVVEIPVVNEPQSLGAQEQQDAWKNRKEK